MNDYCNIFSRKAVFERLIKEITQISNDKELSESFISITNKLFSIEVSDKEELFEKLINEAGNIKDDFYKSEFIKGIMNNIIKAVEVDKTCIFDSIIDFANNVYSDEDRMDAFTYIVESLSEANLEDVAFLLDKIIEYIQVMRDSKEKAEIFNIITEKIAEVNIIEEFKIALLNRVIEIIKDIDNKHKVVLLINFSKVLISNNIYDESLFGRILELTKEISSDKFKSDILITIVKELYPNIEIEDDDINTEHLSELSTEAYNIRQIIAKDILNIINDIYSEKSRSNVIISITTLIYYLHFDKTELNIFFEKIINYTENFKNDYHRDQIYENIIGSFAKNGLYDKAIDFLKFIGDDKRKTFAINKIVNEINKITEI